MNPVGDVELSSDSFTSQSKESAPTCDAPNMPGPLVAHRIEPATTSIGGVVTIEIPVYYVPGNHMPAAGIVFQAGRGFETAAAQGASHIIRHLVAEHLGYQAHGAYDPWGYDVSGFSFVGTTDDVAQQIRELTLALSVLPQTGLESAKAAIERENEGWRPSVVDQLMRYRHGIHGPGALCLEEYGTRKLGEKQLNYWASRFLHRDNAAIWLAGGEPIEFRTRLIHGIKPSPLPPPLGVPTPGGAFGQEGEVCFSIMVPRGTASDAAAFVAELRAQQKLITERGFSNYVIVSSERRTPWISEIVAYADVKDGRDDAVARILLWALDSLVDNPPTPAELDAFRAQASAPYFDQTGTVTFALAHAVGHVTKTPVLSWPEQYTALATLEPEHIRDVVEEGLSTMLVVGGRSVTLLPERFTYIGGWAQTDVEGAVIKPIAQEGEDVPERSLIMGPKGLTVREQDRIATVRFSDCSLLLRDDSGYRELISGTGSRAVVVADAWEHGDKIVAMIDREIPIENTIIFDSSTDFRGGYTGFERRRWAR